MLCEHAAHTFLDWGLSHGRPALILRTAQERQQAADDGRPGVAERGPDLLQVVPRPRYRVERISSHLKLRRAWPVLANRPRARGGDRHEPLWRSRLLLGCPTDKQTRTSSAQGSDHPAPTRTRDTRIDREERTIRQDGHRRAARRPAAMAVHLQQRYQHLPGRTAVLGVSTVGFSSCSGLKSRG